MAPDSGTLLELIGDVQGLLNLDAFRRGLVHALGHAVPADWVSLNDIGPDPASTVVVIEPAFPREDHELFARLAHQNPLIERFAATGDGRAYRFSDVIAPDKLRALELYRAFYGPLGLEHQIAFTLPHPPTRLLGVALSRRDRDFTDDERALLDTARPFLATAYRNAVEHTALQGELRRRPAPLDPPSNLDGLIARGLTPRESEVLGWVATRRSDAEIAVLLEISERTVHKHLQHAYRKLGVRDRADAAMLVWVLAAQPAVADTPAASLTGRS
jgi:DNA-binding CsgD family transcriptional regulator